MIMYLALLWFNFYTLQKFNLVPSTLWNPFEALLFISHRVPSSPDSDPHYQKGYLDITFIAYYIIVWSFVRQSITMYIFHPMAKVVGVKKPAKIDRFGEQGYAVAYFTFTSILGLVSNQAQSYCGHCLCSL